jgi:hypothetical protein
MSPTDASRTISKGKKNRFILTALGAGFLTTAVNIFVSAARLGAAPAKPA